MIKRKKHNVKQAERPSPQQKTETFPRANMAPETPLEEVVFDVIAGRLRRTAEREEIRGSAPGKSENDIESEICSEALLLKLRPVLRAYEVEQAIALLPCLVQGARSANSAALKILNALAFFRVMAVLNSEPNKAQYDIVDAFAENMLHELVHIVETGELRKDTKPAA